MKFLTENQTIEHEIEKAKSRIEEYEKLIQNERILISNLSAMYRPDFSSLKRIDEKWNKRFAHKLKALEYKNDSFLIYRGQFFDRELFKQFQLDEKIMIGYVYWQNKMENTHIIVHNGGPSMFQQTCYVTYGRKRPRTQYDIFLYQMHLLFNSLIRHKRDEKCSSEIIWIEDVYWCKRRENLEALS
jgi:hypothetical protein